MTLGALNLLSVTQTPMGEADLIVARAFADLAALSIVQHRDAADAQRLNEQMSAALTSRVVIEQAKGVISERAGVDLAEAFARLRRYARNHNLRLTDVAEAAVDGTLDPLAWAPPTRPPHPDQPEPGPRLGVMIASSPPPRVGRSVPFGRGALAINRQCIVGSAALNQQLSAS